MVDCDLQQDGGSLLLLVVQGSVAQRAELGLLRLGEPEHARLGDMGVVDDAERLGEQVAVLAANADVDVEGQVGPGARDRRDDELAGDGLYRALVVRGGLGPHLHIEGQRPAVAVAGRLLAAQLPPLERQGMVVQLPVAADERAALVEDQRVVPRAPRLGVPLAGQLRDRPLGRRGQRHSRQRRRRHPGQQAVGHADGTVLDHQHHGVGPREPIVEHVGDGDHHDTRVGHDQAIDTIVIGVNADGRVLRCPRAGELGEASARRQHPRVPPAYDLLPDERRDVGGTSTQWPGDGAEHVVEQASG